MIRTLYSLVFVFFIFFRIAQRKPALVFYIAISLYFDPGGLMSKYFTGFVNYEDITFILCFLPLFSGKLDIKLAFRDPFFRKIFTFLLVYMLYFVVVYGLITPLSYGRNTFFSFLYGFRKHIFSFLLIIPAYLVAYKNVKTFYKTTLYTAFFTLSLFFITIITPLNLITVNTLERYKGSGMMRTYLNSWGIFSIILNFAMIVLVSKIKLKFKNLLYFTGLMMLIAMLLTLTRRLYMNIIGNTVIITYLATHLRATVTYTMFQKIVIYMLIALILLSIFFPAYIDYITLVLKDLYSLFTTGSNIHGQEDYRFAGTGGVAYLKQDISDRPLFGTGYFYKWYDSTDNFSGGRYKAHDNPYLGVFAMFGFVGVLLFYAFYIILIKIIFKIFKNVKNNLHLINQYELIMVTFVFSFFIYKFTLGLGGAAGELIYDFKMMQLMLWTGIILALNNRIKNRRLINENSKC